jgi:hypothetical protein
MMSPVFWLKKEANNWLLMGREMANIRRSGGKWSAKNGKAMIVRS